MGMKLSNMSPAEVAALPPDVLQHLQFEEAEELRANQTEYDPKIHGAGTVAPVAPDSVKDLHKLYTDFTEEVQDHLYQLHGMFNSLVSRMELLENKNKIRAAMAPAPAPGEVPLDESLADTPVSTYHPDQVPAQQPATQRKPLFRKE